MIRTDFDVVVAGGGLVGLSAAKALSEDGLAVGLIDRDGAVQPSSQWDARVYAISPGSEHYLRSLRAWPEDLQRMAAVERMCIFGDRPGSRLEFDAYQSRVMCLATIVENRLLVRTLQQALRDAGKVEWFASEQCEAVEWGENAAVLRLQSGIALRARLVVAADGADSWLRGQAGIDVSEIDYRQSAVVANYSCDVAHRATAFQWFREDGVLALLPLPGNRVSMVWSASDDLAQRLMGLGSDELAYEVGTASNNVLGTLEVITSPVSFPLRCIRVSRLIGPRLALVGDAAHNLHPLAGQGVNLGFQDARDLSRVLLARGPERDVGALSLLRRYERARREDILVMTAATHGLQRLFNQSGTPLAWMRNLGLNLTDRLLPLKSLLVRRALGSPIYHD
jgi:2-polyprenylphenol 6-hydroxylase